MLIANAIPLYAASFMCFFVEYVISHTLTDVTTQCVNNGGDCANQKGSKGRAQILRILSIRNNLHFNRNQNQDNDCCTFAHTTEFDVTSYSVADTLSLSLDYNAQACHNTHSRPIMLITTELAS